MVQIAVAGKSNTGKTTFFSAATLADAEISNRIFTTIEPNKGVTYVRTECPCKKLGVDCSPQNSKCVDGVRFVPVKLIDIAGLVPDAHKGRGLGNRFLSDIMEADALIHIVDASGGTDEDGNPVDAGTNDPLKDIEFFEREVEFWMLGILKKNWEQIIRKSQASGKKFNEVVFQQLSGLKVSRNDVDLSLKEADAGPDSGDEQLLVFIKALRKRSKPVIIAANKMDIPASRNNLKKMKESGFAALPCCAEAELALRRAENKGLIKYLPGSPDFELLGETGEKQKEALNFIREKVLKRFGSTGVQDVINTAVFSRLEMITVYPVASIGKLADSKGNILPDAYLVRRGTVLKEFAGMIHTDLADSFIGGLDITKKKIGADYQLKDGDVVEVLFKG
jgi:hypothetical protein